MTVFVHAFWQVLLDLAPWLLLGALVAGVLHALLPPDFLNRHLSGGSGIFKAVGLGVPLPLCSCAVIPVGLGLKQGGASDGATVAFLISTPQTGIDSILVSASFLGWPFAIFKVASAATTGLLGGWWTDQQPHASLPVITIAASPPTPPIHRWAVLFQHSLALLRSIWRWLLFGVVVSAAIEAFLPTHALTRFTGENEFVAMLMTLAIALPLYVCATASVPIAAALVATGLPAGAALVFLMAGPATNMATMGAVYRTLGRRALAIYLTTVIAGSIVCGWLFGFLIDADAADVIHEHGAATWWAIASAVLLLILLGWFSWEDVRRLANRRQSAPPHPEHTCCE